MLLNEKQAVYWSLANPEVEETWAESRLTLDDFILGPFDAEFLGERPPESDWYVPAGDWSDWFPPPSRMTYWESDVLTDWVEIEAEKHDLIPDPDTYPLDDYFFTKEKHDPHNDPNTDLCSARSNSGASSGISKQPRCPLSSSLVGAGRR